MPQNKVSDTITHVTLNTINGVQFNLINMTLVNMTPSMSQNIVVQPNVLVQNYLFYTTTTPNNVTFRIYVLS